MKVSKVNAFIIMTFTIVTIVTLGQNWFISKSNQCNFPPPIEIKLDKNEYNIGENATIKITINWQNAIINGPFILEKRLDKPIVHRYPGVTTYQYYNETFEIENPNPQVIVYPQVDPAHWAISLKGLSSGKYRIYTNYSIQERSYPYHYNTPTNPSRISSTFTILSQPKYTPVIEKDHSELYKKFSFEQSKIDPLDPDGDYVRTILELFVYGTDPLDADTDGDGLTDFHEIFVYPEQNATDPTDGFTFRKNIPHNKARPVQYSDGGCDNSINSITKKIIDVSLSDPQVLWYVSLTTTKFRYNQTGAARIRENKLIPPKGPEYIETSVSSMFPAYVLTHDVEESVLTQLYCNAAVMKYRGYYVNLTYGLVNNGREESKQFILNVHNRQPWRDSVYKYIVSWGCLYKEEQFYNAFSFTPLADPEIL